MRHRATERISLSKLKQIALASKEQGNHECATEALPSRAKKAVLISKKNGGRVQSEALEMSGSATFESEALDGSEMDQDESCRRFSFSSVSSATTGSVLEKAEDHGAEQGLNEERTESVSSRASASPTRTTIERAHIRSAPSENVSEQQKSIAIHPVTSVESAENKKLEDPEVVSPDATPEDLASILKEWADDFDRAIEGFFSKNKLFDLFGLWIMILLLDASLSSPTRIEWLGFCVLSFSPFHRCIQTSFKAAICLVIFYAASDSIFYYLLRTLAHPKLLPTIANMIVYGHVIGCIRGLDPISWGLWASLLVVDVMAKEPPVSDMESMPAVHCVSYGLYLLLSEIFTILTEYRNERLSCTDAINGELRLYPSYLMTSSLFSKEMSDSVFNQLSWKDGFYSKQEKSLSAEPALGESVSTNTPSSSFAKRTGSSDDLSHASTPQFYYFSNHYDAMNRFELCVLRISRDAVALTWSLPRSLLVTLGGLTKCEPVPPESSEKKPTSSIRPPPPMLAHHLVKTDEPIAYSESSTASNLVYPPVPPLSDPIVITPSDIRITVNGEEWQKERTCLSLLESSFVLTGLKLGVLCEIIMWIKGYASIPLRICSTKDCASLSPVRKASPMKRDRHLREPTEPISLVDAKLRKKAELIGILDHEQQNKRELQSNLKKMRREFSKTLASLRSEIDGVRRTIVKDTALEVKSKQRMQFLYEQLKQTELAIGKLKEEATEVLDAERRLAQESEEVSKDLATLKEGLKRVEKEGMRATAANAKVIASAEADLKDVEAAYRIAKDEVEKIRSEMKAVKAEIQAIQPVRPPKKQKGHKSSNENLRRKMEAELNAIEKDVVIARAAYEGALDRNSHMRRTVEDEARFKERLQGELRRVEVENARVQGSSQSDINFRSSSFTHPQELSGWASFVSGGILPALGSELQTWEMINRNISGGNGFGNSSLPSSRLQSDSRWPRIGFLDSGFRESNAYVFNRDSISGVELGGIKTYGTESSHLELDGIISYNSSPDPVLLATAAEDLKQGYDAMDPMLGPAGQDILTSLGLDLDSSFTATEGLDGSA
ncbi:hypothetical protein HDU67_006258 [Dinochytrium kinnereticum]|nr:hypothetical protein HDU67_006258 [Dinochytrium kinnereticum]